MLCKSVQYLIQLTVMNGVCPTSTIVNTIHQSEPWLEHTKPAPLLVNSIHTSVLKHWNHDWCNWYSCLLEFWRDCKTQATSIVAIAQWICTLYTKVNFQQSNDVIFQNNQACSRLTEKWKQDTGNKYCCHCIVHGHFIHHSEFSNRVLMPFPRISNHAVYS